MRDPRIKPAKGDVLSGKRFARCVITVLDGFVNYDAGDGREGGWWCSLSEWGRWASTAEVVHAEGET